MDLTCTSCNLPKNEDEFYLRKSGRQAGRRLNACISCCIQTTAIWKRTKQYGMVPGEWEAILTWQGNKCGLCGDTDVPQWHTDHDHACCNIRKKSCGLCVRGLLCSPCNTNAIPTFERLKIDPLGYLANNWMHHRETWRSLQW